jgi:hypothetical protein
MLNEILTDDELKEIFQNTYDLLCNSCNTSNTLNNMLHFNKLDSRHLVTESSTAAVTSVAGDKASPSQLSLLEASLEVDLSAEAQKATERVRESCPAPGYLPWLRDIRPGHWRLLTMAENAINAALLSHNSERLKKALTSYETIYRKAYREYEEFYKLSLNLDVPEKCFWCGSSDLWQGDDRKICRRCHPPAPEAEKVRY